MTYRVKISGPNISGPFGVDILEIEDPSAVQVEDGNLLIRTKPYSGAPAVEGPSGTIRARRRATRGSLVVYPEGAWSKSVITDFVDDEEAESDLQERIAHYDSRHGPNRGGTYTCCLNPVDPRTEGFNA